ncbi:MAG: bacteriohopanetetrol glucosamine biosynthesis glycosyltransferase HpnI [Nitrospirae bacterium]|nr:bacteriohopanetetrol glucosamine biosynthesis glycosyltransferase HpnI [Nitrospirota bacterium]
MTVLQAVFFLLWLAAAAFYIISAWCVRSFYMRPRTAMGDAALPPLTVLKPVKGADAGTYENFLSFVLQDYPVYQVIFGIADESDPAGEAVRRLISENPALDISLVVTGEPSMPNAKVCNLMGMQAAVKHGILVIADGDMRVGTDYLRSVAAGFADETVGLVTCLYRAANPRDLGSAFEALTINTDFLPSVAVAERLEGLSFALGATMAVRRDALEAIGGLDRLADLLADDYQLGNLVKKAGYNLRLSGYVVDAVQTPETFAGYFSHQLRWARTYRVCRPGGYFLSVLTKGTASSLFFLVATGFSGAGWSVFAANLLIRYAQAVYIEAAYVRGAGVLRYFWLLPLKDVLSFVIWLMSFTGSVVVWKGERFTVDSDGRMLRVG